jgi:hypothetical protein
MRPNRGMPGGLKIGVGGSLPSQPAMSFKQLPILCASLCPTRAHSSAFQRTNRVVPSEGCLAIAGSFLDMLPEAPVVSL